jgi:hypothetical protein
VNTLYFRCEDCKRYIDAGYRWAYWSLVAPGIVAQDDFGEGGQSLPIVSVDAVLKAQAYWDGAAEAPWLAALFPKVKEFLDVHGSHRLSFGDIQRLEYPPQEWLDWLCDDAQPDESPRYLVEVLRLSRWGDVEKRYRQGRRTPWWWDIAGERMAARRRFEELTQGVVPDGRGARGAVEQ